MKSSNYENYKNKKAVVWWIEFICLSYFKNLQQSEFILKCSFSPDKLLKIDDRENKIGMGDILHFNSIMSEAYLF